MKAVKILALGLVLITLVCGVHAAEENASVPNVNVIPSDLTELPDLDMTGLHADIGIISPVGGIPAILSASNEPDTPGLTGVQP